MIRYERRSRQLQKGQTQSDIENIANDMKVKEHKFLTVDMDRLEKKDLSFLKYFDHIEGLIIRGGTHNQIKNIIISPQIKSLALLGVKVNDYNFLSYFKSLEILDIRGGGCKDFTSLHVLNKLHHLKAVLFMDLRQLDNLDFIPEIKSLQFFRLDGCSKIVTIPSFKKLVNLKRVEIEQMKRLNDICGISDAPNIEELIIHMIKSNLKADNFLCFVNHPSLRKIYAAIDWQDSVEYKKLIKLLGDKLTNRYIGTENEYYTLQ